MAKSGLKFKERKRAVNLSFVERYNVACLIINGMTIDKAAKVSNISYTLAHRIKHEFLFEVIVWKPGVVQKLAERDLFGVRGTLPPE